MHPSYLRYKSQSNPSSAIGTPRQELQCPGKYIMHPHAYGLCTVSLGYLSYAILLSDGKSIMIMLNDTPLPDTLVTEVLKSAVETMAFKAGDEVLAIHVRPGQNQGLMTRFYRPNRMDIRGYHIELMWAINHRDRNTEYAEDKTMDILNALDIFCLCVHEIGHCADLQAGFPAWSDKYAFKNPEEISARNYERQALTNLTMVQWSLVKDLACFCEICGNPNKRRNGYTFMNRLHYDQQLINRFWKAKNLIAC